MANQTPPELPNIAQQQGTPEPVSLKTLLWECHDLLEQVAHRPGAIKWLLAVKVQLMAYVQYKATRRSISQRRQVNPADKGRRL